MFERLLLKALFCSFLCFGPPAFFFPCHSTVVFRGGGYCHFCQWYFQHCFPSKMYRKTLDQHLIISMQNRVCNSVTLNCVIPSITFYIQGGVLAYQNYITFFTIGNFLIQKISYSLIYMSLENTIYMYLCDRITFPPGTRLRLFRLHFSKIYMKAKHKFRLLL